MSGAPADREAATEEFAAFVEDLAARRRVDPAEDLLSELVGLEAHGDALDRDELVAMIQLLLIAGQETAVYVIAKGLRLLLMHPEQWAALRDDPTLATAVVEEVLRYDGPVELGANRDPEVFTRADVFDIHRTDAGRHLGFGHGAHFCLGAALGRVETRIMFERIAEALPGLRLAGDPHRVPRINPHGGELLLLPRSSRACRSERS